MCYSDRTSPRISRTNNETPSTTWGWGPNGMIDDDDDDDGEDDDQPLLDANGQECDRVIMWKA